MIPAVPLIHLHSRYLQLDLNAVYQSEGDASHRAPRTLFAQPWNFRLAYAFHPPLLLCVIQKISVSSSVLLLVTPFWPAQKWFPAIMGLQVMDVHRSQVGPAASSPSSSTRLEHFWRLRGLAVSDASFRLIRLVLFQRLSQCLLNSAPFR